MNEIINKLKQGAHLKPMESAGPFFEDGFYLSFEKNGLKSVSEVLTGDVLSLEGKGLIFWNAGLWRYVLTKRGEGV